jgi:simple sugar transport system permease protein
MVFVLQKTLIYAIPLLIVALAGMFAERSGIVNIALDGMMIFGSYVGAVVALALRTHFPYFVEHNQLTFVIAMLAAAAAGALFSLLLSVSAIKFKADQTIGGTALNLLAPAITLFLIKLSTTKDSLEMTPARDPAGQLHDFSYVIKRDGLSPAASVLFDKAYISTFIALAVFILLSVLLYKTKTGLRLRACGENPAAVDAVGVNVYKMRYLGTTISGALGGLGGYIYIATVANGTASGTVAGMGFLALAILIFGNWKPLGVALGALLFGFLKCLSVVYTQIEFTRNLGLPMYFYNMIPYVVVLVLLAFTSHNSRAPKAEGVPYDKGRR